MTEKSTGQDNYFLKYTMNNPLIGTMCGVAVVVLAILGIAHVFPVPLAALAVLIFGASLLVKGALISIEYRQLLAHLSGGKRDKVSLGGGASGEILTGLTGIILGILAILQIAPQILMAVAVITFGAGALMGSQVISRLNALKLEHLGTVSNFQCRLEHEVVSAAVGIQILVGIAAIVLGILSLIGFVPETLTLVALLILGVDSIISGSALLEKLIGDIR